MKTSELTGAALDWAVAKCEGYAPFSDGISWIIECTGVYRQLPKYSTDWAHGGPIIERECIFIAPTWDGENAGSSARASRTAWIEGPTPLIAAMRCYVASKLGDNIEIPSNFP